jgi:hypothetical protein
MIELTIPYGYTRPIKYRSYVIHLADDNPTPFNYAFYHEDYDGEGDERNGVAITITDAKTQIDALEDGE